MQKMENVANNLFKKRSYKDRTGAELNQYFSKKEVKMRLFVFFAILGAVFALDREALDNCDDLGF